MPENWDADYNTTSLTNEERTRIEQAEAVRQEAIYWENYRVEEENRRRAREEFELPYISDEEVRRRFPYYANSENPDRTWHSRMAQYTANRPHWVCHNCGNMGWKQTFRERFKCYYCHSRDVSVVRAGDIANAVRMCAAGINMTQVWENRQARRRAASRR